MSEPRSAPTAGRLVPGRRLRDLRGKAGLRRQEAAKVLHAASATIRGMETAEAAPRIPCVRLPPEAYGTTGREAETFVAPAPAARTSAPRSPPASNSWTACRPGRQRHDAWGSLRDLRKEL
jgi:DNA-binding XRE family transcriptional regulator